MLQVLQVLQVLQLQVQVLQPSSVQQVQVLAPVQVLAFAAPRPFDMAWAELDPQRPANDPALAEALNEHELSSPPKPVLEPVGPAGHSE